MRNEATLDTHVMPKRTTRRGRRFGFALIATLVLSILAVPITFADGGRDIDIQDKCDPITFNAFSASQGGDPICFKAGGVTIDEFLEKLNPLDGGHHAWRYSRTDLGIKVGQVVRVTNMGGEVHSFTEVSMFGAGIVPPLNAALPPGTLDAVPVPFQDPRFTGPGQGFSISDLSIGSHKFQCLIHPWMRTVIQVSGN